MPEKTGIIIQARMSSARLPGKSLMMIGNHPLIWYVLKRAEATGLPVVVATSTDYSDDSLCDYLRKEKIPFFRGYLQNVLNRYIKCAEKFGFEKIVRVTGDNPLFDFEFLQKNINLFNSYNYVDGIYEGGLIKGAGFELVKLKELKKIPFSKKEHLEHVTLYLREHLADSEDRIQISPNEINFFREEIILTCDYHSDFVLLNEIFRNFSYRPDILLPEIIYFLDQNPYLKKLNKNRDGSGG